MPVFYNSQPSGPAPTEISLPGIDAAAGIKRFANKKELYLKSLTKFLTELPDEYAPFSEFSKEEVRAESAAYVHTIKGVVGNLSMIDLYDLTVTTEQYVKNGTLTVENYAVWTNKLIEAKAIILPLLADLQPAAAVVNKGTLTDFIKILNDMREPLEFFNSTKCDELLVSIKKFKWEGVSDEFIKKLSANIDDFEYDSALTEIEAFIGKEAN